MDDMIQVAILCAVEGKIINEKKQNMLKGLLLCKSEK